MKELNKEIAFRGSFESITVDELKSLASRYNVDGIYLINKDGVVINSTYDKDINLNLNKVNTYMDGFMHSVYGKGIPMTHRALVSKYNKLNKFIYYSPKGADYAIEISFDIKKYLSSKYRSSYTDYLFIDGLKKFANQNVYLDKVEVYDVTS